ncbi:MAG TPA: hypothetical protein VD860_16095, partial [Azospirillum sp.]|nr:hypothetical protein [Azospirillum sp.]
MNCQRRAVSVVQGRENDRIVLVRRNAPWQVAEVAGNIAGSEQPAAPKNRRAQDLKDPTPMAETDTKR